ncbi:MAG: patatin-like phospholipase family protein [Coriobacteriales bacterium]
MHYIEDPTFSLPPEIYTPCNTPGYTPAYVGHEPIDLTITVEGGALRGIFAAGALDFLLDVGVIAKNLVGVSAGALSGFSYVSGERGRSCYVNVRFCTEWRYLSMRSFMTTGNAYGVKFAFHDIAEKYCPQDNAGFRSSPCNLIATVTNLETGQAEFMHVVDPETDLIYLRASSAMPFVSQTVIIDGKPYLDGGISDAIPVEHSIGLGNKKQIVLLTQDRAYRKEKSRIYDFGSVVYHNFPNFCEAMNTRHLRYNKERAKIAQMAEAGEIFAIYPQVRPEVKHMETDRNKLFSLYMDGYLETQRQWPALRKYLEI